MRSLQSWSRMEMVSRRWWLRHHFDHRDAAKSFMNMSIDGVGNELARWIKPSSPHHWRWPDGDGLVQDVRNQIDVHAHHAPHVMHILKCQFNHWMPGWSRERGASKGHDGEVVKREQKSPNSFQNYHFRWKHSFLFLFSFLPFVLKFRMKASCFSTNFSHAMVVR